MLYFKHYVFEFCTYVYFSFKHFRLHLIRVFESDECKSRSLGTDRKKGKMSLVDENSRFIFNGRSKDEN